MRSLIISGCSGAGKSTVLHSLEDSGFSCIDNFPASLLVQLIESQATSSQATNQDLAICIDARNSKEELVALPSYINHLRATGQEPRLIFLEASDAVLVKRFSETRRRHPLDDQFPVLIDALAYERQLLEPIFESADLRIDTTNRTMQQLDSLIKERVAGHVDKSISLLFQSFGYKYGIPLDADIVFDARCLPNPYWHEELRNFNGLHSEIKNFLGNSSLVGTFLEDMCNFLNKWLPTFSEQRRVYITVGIGCTGGTHRSVYLVERLAEAFRSNYPNLVVRHREGIEHST